MVSFDSSLFKSESRALSLVFTHLDYLSVSYIVRCNLERDSYHNEALSSVGHSVLRFHLK